MVFRKFILDPLQEACEYWIQVMLEGVSVWIVSPTDLSRIPFVETTLKYMQYIALSLLVISVIYEILKSFTNEMYGNGGKSIDLILFQAIKAVILIYASPFILEEIIIKSNNALLGLIPSFGVNFGYLDQRFYDDITQATFGLVEGVGALIIMIFIVFIIGIALMIIVLIGGYRYAQLSFLLVISPLLAVSTSNQGEAYNVWVREAIAVTFTQCLHFWLLTLFVELFVTPTFWNLMMSLGVLIIMITGPAAIKPYIHSSGVGGALVGTGRFAVYRMLTRSAISGVAGR